MSTLNIEEIKTILPHRFPFLLLDRVVETGSDFAKGIKNVTINEPFFPGHFPGEAIMPGVLQVEAMAQLAAVFKLQSLGKHSGSVYFMTIDKVKFRRKVVPGDTLQLEIKVLRDTGTRLVFSGKAYVDDQLASEAEMMAMVQFDNKT